MPRKTYRKSRLQRAYTLYELSKGRASSVLLWKQSGGGSFFVNQTQFNYDETIDGNIITVTSKKASSFPECFILEFNIFEGQRYACLLSLSSTKKCRPDTSVPTSDLVRELLKYAKERGAKWVELQDETTLCDGDEKVSLADYYMLTRGKTWYESIDGFLPDKTEDIEYCRSTASTNRWGDVLRNFKSRNSKKYSEFMKELVKIVPNADPNELAMNVLSRIPIANRCSIFSKYLYYFLIASNLSSIKGFKWYLLMAENIVRPNTITTDWNVQLVKED